ncbi:MAG TPA: hypothetical protein VIU15_20230, partial [Streptomyces sp.]
TRAVRTVAPPSFSALLTSALMACLPGSHGPTSRRPRLHIVARDRPYGCLYGQVDSVPGR